MLLSEVIQWLVGVTNEHNLRNFRCNKKRPVYVMYTGRLIRIGRVTTCIFHSSYSLRERLGLAYTTELPIAIGNLQWQFFLLLCSPPAPELPSAILS